MAETNWWTDILDPDLIFGDVDYFPLRHSEPEYNESFVFTLPGSPEATPDDLPDVFALGRGHPNPFNPVITVPYQVPRPGGFVHIEVYNVNGQRVATLVNAHKPPGFYRIVWDGTAPSGPVASGVYFLRMEAEQFFETQKIVLLK